MHTILYLHLHTMFDCIPIFLIGLTLKHIETIPYKNHLEAAVLNGETMKHVMCDPCKT